MSARRSALAVLVAGLVFAPILAAQAPAPAATPPAATPVAWRVFTDLEGKPLPFQSDAELLDFLRTANVVSDKRIGGGINNPRELVLEKNGVQAHAVFRDVNEEKNSPSFGAGRNDLFFRDSYVYEPAAYEVGLMLGLDNVPPATLRKLFNEKGSVQIFVEHAMTETKQIKDGIPIPDDQEWKKQVQMMNVFDALIYNTDRNRGNILITPDWRLWMIDHTRAFRRNTHLENPDSITQCERGLYEKLKSFDEAAAKERLKEYLSPFELDALLTRRKLLVGRIDKLIAEKGEDKVLYTFAFYPVSSDPVTPAH